MKGVATKFFKEKKGMANDAVNHPSHYTDGKIEVITYIDDKNFNYCRGNAIKYISRAGKKNPEKEIEDLKKAEWYIHHEIERLQKLKEQKIKDQKIKERKIKDQKIKEEASKRAKESWTELPKTITRFNGEEYNPVLDDEEQK